MFLVEINLPPNNVPQPEIWQDLQTDYAHQTPRIPARHNGGFNIVWADGHAKWMKHGSTRAYQWSVQED